MKNTRIFCALTVTLFVLLAGCSNPRIPPTGARFYVEELPKIQSFSAKKLESYEMQFSPVEEVTLYRNGQKERISEDDPRLIRLINFIAKSENDSSVYVRQGLIPMEEVMEKYCSRTYLEVIFRTPIKGDSIGLKDISKILVSKSALLMFLDDDRIEEHFPYMELFEKMVTQGYVAEEDIQNELSGHYPGDPWIDLLTIAGFTVTNTGDG